MQRDVGLGAAAWHLEVGLLFTVQVPIRLFQPSSTQCEWLAGLISLWHLRGWSGTVYIILDSANTCTHRFTRGPAAPSLLAKYFRYVHSTNHTLQCQDLWIESQHVSGATSLLTDLKCHAHGLAQAIAPSAAPLTVVLPEALHGCSVGTIDGALVLDPATHIAQLYARALRLPLTPQLHRWTASA